MTQEISRRLINGEWVTGSAAEASGGGGSQSVEVVRVNGIVKDYAMEASVAGVAFDARAQDWQPGTVYSNSGVASGGGLGAQVHRVGDATVKFVAFENGSAVSGTVEPEWSEDGSTTLDDGTASRPLLWTPQWVWAGAWQATHAFDNLTAIIANGFVWVSDGGGNTGGSEPDWPDAPDLNETVSDGAITWTNWGPGTVWAPSTRYSFRINADPTTGYAQANVIPTDAVAGTSYVFVGQPTGLFGTTGSTEPDWGAATSGDVSNYIDGDIMWQETTSTEAVALTGIVAPAAASAVMIYNADVPDGNTTVEIPGGDAESNYGTQAVSSAGNEIAGGSTSLNTVNSAELVYVNDQWQRYTPASA